MPFGTHGGCPGATFRVAAVRSDARRRRDNRRWLPCCTAALVGACQRDDIGAIQRVAIDQPRTRLARDHIGEAVGLEVGGSNAYATAANDDGRIGANATARWVRRATGAHYRSKGHRCVSHASISRVRLPFIMPSSVVVHSQEMRARFVREFQRRQLYSPPSDIARVPARLTENAPSTLFLWLFWPKVGRAVLQCIVIAPFRTLLPSAVLQRKLRFTCDRGG